MNDQMRKAETELAKLPGLKEADLIKLGNCRVCGRPQFGTGGLPFFYKVTISRAGFDGGAVQRRVGLQMAMGGAGALAGIMGPDEDIAKVFDGPHDAFVHESCADKIHHLLQLIPEGDKGDDR